MLPTLVHALIAGLLSSPAADPIAAAAALPAMVGTPVAELEPEAPATPGFVAGAPGAAAPVKAGDPPPPATSGSPIAQGPGTAKPVTGAPAAPAPAAPAAPPQPAKPVPPAPPPPPSGPPPANLLPPADAPAPPSGPGSALEQGARGRPTP